MSRTYMKRTCWVCQREVSCGGLGYTSHMRAHVRKGEIIERLRRDSTGTYSTFERKREPEKASGVR